MDWRRATKLVWGVAWTFSCKTLQTEKSSRFRSGEYGSQSSPEFRHGFPQELLGGTSSVTRCRILLKDIIAVRIHPLDPGDDMLPQKVLINVSVDAFAGANENDRTLLAVTAYHTQDHLLQWSLGFGRDAEVGIHVGYREVRQVEAVVAVDSHVHSEDLLIRKISDLARLAGLQLVHQLLTPPLSCFLCIHGQKQLLDDHAALQSEVLLYQVSHVPRIYLVMPCQLPNAPLWI